jgi:hypothetical protein
MDQRFIISFPRTISTHRFCTDFNCFECRHQCCQWLHFLCLSQEFPTFRCAHTIARSKNILSCTKCHAYAHTHKTVSIIVVCVGRTSKTAEWTSISSYLPVSHANNSRTAEQFPQNPIITKDTKICRNIEILLRIKLWQWDPYIRSGTLFCVYLKCNLLNVQAYRKEYFFRKCGTEKLNINVCSIHFSMSRAVFDAIGRVSVWARILTFSA